MGSVGGVINQQQVVSPLPPLRQLATVEALALALTPAPVINSDL